MPKRRKSDGANVSQSKSFSEKEEEEEREEIEQVIAAKKVKTEFSENELTSPSSMKKTKKKNKRAATEDDTTEDNKDDEMSEDAAGDLQSKKKKSPKKAENSTRFVVFVGQIPHHVTKKDIERHFTSIGNGWKCGLKDVRLLIYPDSGKPRGCAYVEFLDKKQRSDALKLNDSNLGGAKIRVELPYQGGKKYKKSEKSQRKRSSGKKRS